MALGAHAASVVAMFVGRTIAVAGLGVVIGLGIAVVLTRQMSAVLFEVSPVDPVTYAAVSAALLTAATVAGYVPARRAAGIDPGEALRPE
jgi:ABC-type antimicrobial peptide transport system permease subunit